MSPSATDDESSVDIQEDEFDANPELALFSNLAAIALLGPPTYHFVLAAVAKLDPEIRRDLEKLSTAEEFISNNPVVGQVILECCKSRKFRDLRRMREIRTIPKSVAFVASGHIAHTAEANQQNATVESWRGEFRGDAVKLLKSTLDNFLERGSESVYAPYTTIINSSGTGKSRLVDELAKEVVVVYMCLRKKGTEGFPPADNELRDWLMAAKDSEERANKRTSGLVYALLHVTRERLEQIENELGDKCPINPVDRYRSLASNFRERMVDGQKFDCPNNYHLKFYEDVIAEGKKFEANAVLEEPVEPTVSPKMKSTGDDGKEKSILEAAKEMYEFFNHEEIGRPLLVFAFDESHDLTIQPSEEGSWTVFSSLRRALRGTRFKSIFSIFLSTAGRYQEFSPEPPFDRSSRVQKAKLKLLPSIPEVGFDTLAKLISEDEVTLAEIATVKHMAHLGRPLFGSRYDAGNPEVRKDLIRFAIAKLTGRESDLDSQAILACLAIRFALEFRPKSPEERRIELQQVERHMRICLAASPGYQKVVTISASEPLLAEAAKEVMLNSDIPRALADSLEKMGIHRGDRGELAAMLVVMAARDRAASKKRVISVLEFMKALLPDSYHKTLSKAPPSVSPFTARDTKSSHEPSSEATPSVSPSTARNTRSSSSKATPSVSPSKAQDKKSSKATPSVSPIAKTFEETFKKSRIWFNHFIKVEDYNIINVRYLWLLILRGAAVLCANNQQSIDILLPVVYGEAKIGRQNTTAILIQVKNDISFTYNIKPHLFDVMDPFAIGIFDKSAKALPVIRLVFALAATRPPTPSRPRKGKAAVQFVSPQRKSLRLSTPELGYTSWDIWFAGLASETFGVVTSKEEESYKVIMGRSYISDDAYAVWDDDLADDNHKVARGMMRRTMNPGTQSVAHHFCSYANLPKDIAPIPEEADISEGEPVEMQV